MLMRSFRKDAFFPLSGRIITKEFIGFDCETITSEKNKFRCCSFWFSDTLCKTFFDKRDAINFIFNQKHLFQNKFIVATNLQFDLISLFFGEPEYEKLKIIWSNSQLLTARLVFPDSKHKGHITFVDTTNFLFASVETLGKIINIEKMKIDKKLFAKKVLTYDEKELMIKYNQNDAMISAKYMYHLQNTINKLGGNIKITASSTALDLYRRRFMNLFLLKEEIVLKDKSITDFIFKSYYGGRCEVFKKGTFDNVNYYDVNSLYPTMMLNKFPIPQCVKYGNNTVNCIKNYHGVSECIINIPENINIPMIPHRYKHKTVFPVGRIKGVWTHEILRYAISCGCNVEEIFKQIIYTVEDSIFKEYVETLYNLRKEYKKNKNPEEKTVKMLLNSLYGKFGEKPHNIYEVVSKENMNEKLLLKKMKNGFKIEPSADNKFFIMTKKGKRYSKNSFPILASYVTSYAQVHMHKFLSRYNPIYTDTDSILTQETIPNFFISDTELGKFKLEKMGNLEVEGSKCYAFNGFPVIKGLKIKKKDENNEPIPKEQQYKIFKEYINGEIIPQECFIKLKSSLRKKDIMPNQIINTTKQKHKEIYPKRIYEKIESKPILLNEV